MLSGAEERRDRLSGLAPVLRDATLGERDPAATRDKSDVPQ